MPLLTSIPRGRKPRVAQMSSLHWLQPFQTKACSNLLRKSLYSSDLVQGEDKFKVFWIVHSEESFCLVCICPIHCTASKCECLPKWVFLVFVFCFLGFFVFFKYCILLKCKLNEKSTMSFEDSFSGRNAEFYVHDHNFDCRWNASKEGWKSQVAPPPRKDFALFMRIQIIGSSNLSDSKRPGSMTAKDGM